MSVMYIPGYKIRRSTKVLSIVVKSNHNALEIMGEPMYLLTRYARAAYDQDITRHDDWTNRRIPTITKAASSYSTDPDTGFLRCKLWEKGTDSDDEYPDIGVMTCTVTASGGTSVWEPAVDKYSFIAGRNEYASDIYRDQLDTNGNPVTDAMYIVFNTPPFTLSNSAIFNFGTINPLVDFAAMQPVRDNQTGFQNSLFGFTQWLKPDARIRRKIVPHSFLLAFPGTIADFTIEDSGLVQRSLTAYWTTPPPYSPRIEEHDVIVRDLTGARYMVTSTTPIFIENILVSQHLDLAIIDARSSLFNIPIIRV